jgi:hypothetical protein
MSLEEQSAEPVHRSALKDPQRRGRMIIGGVSLLIGAGYFWQAVMMPQGSPGQPGPGVWPSAVGGAWILISILVIVEAAVSVQVGGEVDLPTGVERRNVVLFFVFTTIFVILIPIAGMYLASIAYVIAMLKLTSQLPWWKIILFGAGIGFIIPFLFIFVLQIRLPLGFLDLLF